jgi:hypothetical protein
MFFFATLPEQNIVRPEVASRRPAMSSVIGRLAGVANGK